MTVKVQKYKDSGREEMSSSTACFLLKQVRTLDSQGLLGIFTCFMSFSLEFVSVMSFVLSTFIVLLFPVFVLCSYLLKLCPFY